MNTSIGWATLQVIPSFKGFQGALEQGTGKHMMAAGRSGGTQFGDVAGKAAGSKFGSIFKTAAKASLLGAAGAGAIAAKFGADAIGHASDLNESINAVNVTYGKQSKAVRKLGREAADALGLSQTEFQGLSVQFSSFAKTIGKDGKGTVATLDELTTRGADFASVMNLEVNEAMGLFQSGLAGETEPLRRFGLNLSAAAVESFAYAKGIAETGEELTEAEKIQARYGLLMQQTAKTQGDFANTSDSLANVQRRLNARWDDAQAKLGTALLPYMEDAAGFLLREGVPAFERFSDWFSQKGLPAIQDFADGMRPLAKSVLPAAGDALGIAADALKTAAPLARDMVDAFNDMPDWAKTALLGGGAGLVAGKKFGLGKGVGKLASGAIGSAKPIPVFVTNPGFGGAGGTAGNAGKFAPLAAAGKLGVVGGVTVGSGILLEWAEPLNGKGGKVPGLIAGFLRDTFEDTDKVANKTEDARAKFAALHGDLTKRIKLNFDNRPILDAQAELRRLIALQETANNINPRYGGANAVHRGKLYGDTYAPPAPAPAHAADNGARVNIGQMNFNGVDLNAARREVEHERRVAALGGADFR